MYIITDYKDVVMYISTTINYENNGNVLLDNGTGIAKNIVKEVFEVAEVTTGVEEQKYCYTQEQGFYENPNYEEPQAEITPEAFAALQQEVTDLQLAFIEYAEGGGAE